MRAIVQIICISCTLVCCIPAIGGEVTGGYIQITGGIPVGRFSLSGRGFDANGGFGFGAWAPLACRYGCKEGTLLSVNGYELGNDFDDGSANVNGISFPNVVWGDLNAQGPSIFMVTGPSIVLNHGAGTYFGTFSFAGSLCGTIDYTGECAAYLPSLGGSGKVAVELDSFTDYNGELLLSFQQATYTFLTPEPGTITLLGSGILGFAGVLCRRFKK